MHLVFEHLVEVLVHAVVLEWKHCLLVTLFSLLSLSDLRNLIPYEVMIFGLGVMFFSGSRSISHGNSLHQLFHGIHHHVELVI